MQTFMPLPSFRDSLTCLDNKRLGNQVYREGLTLYKGGWPNHPASKMWQGYKFALAVYCIEGLRVLQERGRGYPHWHEYFLNEINKLSKNGTDFELPPWMGDNRLHSSHRAALLHKNWEHYSQFGWEEEPVQDYFWPTNNGY